MPRTCTVCNHANRADIDAALVNKASFRVVSRQYRVSTDALQRHQSSGHVLKAIAKAEVAVKQERDLSHALDLVQQLIDINVIARRVMTDALQSGDGKLALTACAEVLKQSEFQARIEGALKDNPTVNVLIMPEWGTIRAALLAALMPYPEARSAVAGRLLEIEGAHVGK